MESIDMEYKDKQIHINGFPNAVKVIVIEGKLSKRLSDLSLHINDLQLANTNLDTLNQEHIESAHVRETLWRSAIVHFLKCFGNGARFQLSPTKIYKDEPPEAMVVFNYFKSLRNKHLVHDENSYSQSIPGAIINDGTKDYKVEKIVCFTAVGATLEENNYRNLKLLIEKATKSVQSEFDMLCNKLTDELEEKEYEELLNMKSMSYTVPTVDQIHKSRKKV